jgi:hypothetical protein
MQRAGGQGPGHNSPLSPFFSQQEMLKQQKRGHMSGCLPGCVSRRIICLLVSSTVLGAAGYLCTSASFRQRHAPDFAGFQGPKRLFSSPNHKIVTSIGAATTYIEK